MPFFSVDGFGAEIVEHGVKFLGDQERAREEISLLSLSWQVNDIADKRSEEGDHRLYNLLVDKRWKGFG